MSQDLSRLRAQLVIGKVKELDPPTFQVINALINEIIQLKKALETRITGVEGEAEGIKGFDYLTSSDESGDLPNSRELKAGARIAFDDSVANERTISASAINQLTGDVTAGPGSGSVAATIANDAVTYAKIQNVTASRLLGRGSLAGTGDTQELSIGPGLTLTDTTLTAQGSEWDVLTDGDTIEPELIFDSFGEVIMLETS